MINSATSFPGPLPWLRTRLSRWKSFVDKLRFRDGLMEYLTAEIKLRFQISPAECDRGPRRFLYTLVDIFIMTSTFLNSFMVMYEIYCIF